MFKKYGCGHYMEPIYIYAKKGNLLLLLLASAIFSLMGGLLTIYGLAEPNEAAALVAGVIILLPFGTGLVYVIKKMKRLKPALIISGEGVHDYSMFIGAGLVRWESIRSIKFTRGTGQLYLCIKTKDPNLIIDRTTGFKKLLLRINRKILPAQLNIPLNTLAYSSEQLHQDLHTAWKYAVSHRQAE